MIEVEHEATAAVGGIVSPDRMPQERLIVGYKNAETGKDFNKIYRDVVPVPSDALFRFRFTSSESTLLRCPIAFSLARSIRFA